LKQHLLEKHIKNTVSVKKITQFFKMLTKQKFFANEQSQKAKILDCNKIEIFELSVVGLGF